MNSDTIMLLMSVGIGLLAAIIGYLLISKRTKGYYDEVERTAKLDEVRGSLEKQLYAVNERLVQSEERWRDVNHLLLRNEVNQRSLNAPSRKTHYSDFLRGNGINENDLLVDDKFIFVLTPFNDKYAEDFKVIRDACTNSGFKCARGDERPFKGDIFPEMLRLILKASLVIANINGRSANVLYELGIAQALDKPVILISREPEKLPVDIKSKLFLIYRTYEDLQLMIRRHLLNLSNLNE
jgi:hypothetical protein